MSRPVTPFQGPCHDGEEWTCVGCERVFCGSCDVSPGEPEFCIDCFEAEDPDGDEAA